MLANPLCLAVALSSQALLHAHGIPGRATTGQARLAALQMTSFEDYTGMVTPTDEASAKAAWLARQNAPAWGAAGGAPATMVSAAPVAAAPATAEESAKAAWLATQSVPTAAPAAPLPTDAAPLAESPVTDQATAQVAWLNQAPAPTATGAPPLTFAQSYLEYLKYRDDLRTRRYQPPTKVPDSAQVYNSAGGKLSALDLGLSYAQYLQYRFEYLASQRTSAQSAPPLGETVEETLGQRAAQRKAAEEAAKAAWLARQEKPSWGQEVSTADEAAAGPGLMQKIKDAGVAGIVSYMFWELAFWGLSVPVCIAGYHEVTGHWPDLHSQEDLAQLGAEAFAFVNLARFAVPLRIGLALSTVPWVQANIIDRVGGADAGAPRTWARPPGGSRSAPDIFLNDVVAQGKLSP